MLHSASRPHIEEIDTASDTSRCAFEVATACTPSTELKASQCWLGGPGQTPAKSCVRHSTPGTPVCRVLLRATCLMIDSGDAKTRHCCPLTLRCSEGSVANHLMASVDDLNPFFAAGEAGCGYGD